MSGNKDNPTDLSGGKSLDEDALKWASREKGHDNGPSYEKDDSDADDLNNPDKKALIRREYLKDQFKNER